MSSQDSDREQLRVGIKFLRPPSAMQASLDRYVFALMRRKARASAALGGEGSERRLSPRVELETSDQLLLTLLPSMPKGVLGKVDQVDEPGLTFQVSDISTTGGCFICHDVALSNGEQIRIRLEAEELSIELQAKVVYSKSS